MSLQDMIILQNKCEELEEKLAKKHQELQDCEDCSEGFLELTKRYDQHTTDLVNREAVIGDLKEKLAEAQKSLVDYETDWVKMRKYYDGAMEKMKMLDEAIEVIGFYADHGTYTQSNMRNDCSNVFICDSGPFKIMGKRAREFLEKIKRN